MRARTVPVLVVAIGLLGGCSDLTANVPAAETAFEGLPGPAYLNLGTEPEAALLDQGIVLTMNGERQLRPTAVLTAADLAATGGASIVSIDGRRQLHLITLPPSILTATVNGLACDRNVELSEDHEVDVTLVIDGDRCDLRLDLRHRDSDEVHGLIRHLGPPSG
jgi:hypothetical protein